MAAIEYSVLVDHVSGRMGDLIFQRRKQTRYVRRYTPPRDRRSPAQLRRRGQFRALVALWRTLDAGIQAAWNKEAADLNMSGYNLFISRNMHRMNAEHPGENAHCPFPDVYGKYPCPTAVRFASPSFRSRFGYALTTSYPRTRLFCRSGWPGSAFFGPVCR
ncbi:MAG: hypothetical protein AABZ39_07185 [Spirochaetota bacterium]